MKMKKHAILVVVVIALAAFFRLAWIGGTPPGLYPDEAMNGNNALEAISTGDYKIFYPENNGREGMFINIQAFFLKSFLNFYPNPEPWMLRFTSALFGILTVAGIYFLAKELFEKNERKKTIALVSAFLLATSFWHINFSRIGFRAIMAPCFLVWGVYFLLLTFRKSEERENVLEKNPKHEILNPKQYQNSNVQNSKPFRSFGFRILDLFRIWNLGFGVSALAFLAGAVYGLGMHSYIAYRATPALVLFIFILLGIRNGWKKTLGYAALFCVGAVIVSLPLILYFAENPSDFLGRTSQVSVFSGASPIFEVAMNSVKTIGMLFVGGDANWRHNFPGHAELFWPVAICFVIGTIIGIRELINPKHETLNPKQYQNSNIQTSKPFRSFRFRILDLFRVWDLGFMVLCVWLVVAMLPVIVSNEGIPHALRSILMIPPVYIIATVGAGAVYEYLKKILRKSSIAWLVGICAVLLVLNTYISYFVLWGKNANTKGAFTEEYVKIGQMINTAPKNIMKYVIVDASGTDVRGIPMPTQTVMFITDTFTPEKQKEKNVVYVLPEKIGTIPENSFTATIR
jgi:4-amino-4-deoxy-L-arabinose transferase-like glycosyltransferase